MAKVHTGTQAPRTGGEPLAPPIERAGALRWMRDNLFNSPLNAALTLLAIWFLWTTIPPILVYTLVHFGQAGYVLTILPALVILLARILLAALARVAERVPRAPLGAALTAVWHLRGARRAVSAADLTPAARRLLTIAALPMAASIAYEWGTGDVPSNLARAATGLVLGAAVAYVILAAAESTR